MKNSICEKMIWYALSPTIFRFIEQYWKDIDIKSIKRLSKDNYKTMISRTPDIGSFRKKSLAPSATPPSLPSSPPVGGSMPHLQSNYFVDIILVLHEQSDPITHESERYEQSLRDKGLPDVPLHSGPLLTGHEGYEGMPLAGRRRLPSSFRILFRNLPVRHVCAALRLSEYGNMGHVEAAMRCGEPPPRQPRGIPHKEKSFG